MEHIYKMIMENAIKGNIEKETAKSVLKELKAVTQEKKADIAIIGMAARYPEADNIEQFWDNIKMGRNLVGNIPEKRKHDIVAYLNSVGIYDDKIKYSKEAYLEEIDKFDYRFFKITPKEANLMDPNQRLFMETAINAIEDAGYSETSVKGSKMGVFFGFSNDLREDYSRLLIDSEVDSLEIAVAGNLSSIIPSRISYYLDLKGPSMTIGTSCSSSLVSVHLACNSLLKGECDTALVGSSKIDIIPTENKYKLGIEAEDGRTKAFDDRGDGTGLGEGVAAVILKPLDKAIEDGDNIYAIIKGSAINQDGKTAGITVPNAEAQKEVILKAWENAKINPSSVSYIETHGTGTKLGDPIEIEGINNAFKVYTDKRQFCAIGSVKTNIGHLYEGAGLASLIKAVMALKHKQLPPTIGFQKPNSRIDFCNSAIYVNDFLKEWESVEGPRRCGVSSFGFSGTNCHIVLEEYEKHVVFAQRDRKNHVLAISAKSKNSLKYTVEKYLRNLENIRNMSINDVCYTSMVGREHYEYRIAFLFRNYDELEKQLKVFVADESEVKKTDSIYYGVSKLAKQGNVNIGDNEITLENKRKYSRKLIECINALDRNSEENYSLYNEICKLYIMGADVDWEQFFSNERCSRVSLPTYAFEKTRCWYVPGFVKRDSREDVVKRPMFSKSIWVKEYNNNNNNKATLEKEDNILLINCKDKRNELLAMLKQKSRSVIEMSFGEKFEEYNADSFMITGKENEYNDVATIIIKRRINKVIFNLETSDTNTSSLEQMEIDMNRSVNSLFFMLKAFVRNKISQRLDIFIVARNVNKVLESDQVANPIHNALFGLCKSAQKEFNQFHFKCIDTDMETASSIWLDDTWNVNDPTVVAFRKNERYVEKITYVDVEGLPKVNCEIHNNGVYVITGGLGGLGLELAKSLSRKCNVKLILINRSKLPERKKWDNIISSNADSKLCRQVEGIREIEQNGSLVECFSADTASISQMTEVLEKVHYKYQKINGIFHCSGVAGKGFIRNKDFNTFDEVLRSKIYGTWILDRLTQEDELDFMVLFSSEASLLAMPGQSDYTAANSFLDSFAMKRSQKGRRTLSINWPAWKEAGIAKDNGIVDDTMFKQISIIDGMSTLFKLLNVDITRVIVGEWTYNADMFNLAKLSVSDEIAATIEEKLLPKIVTKKDKIYKKVNLEGREDNNYSHIEQSIANAWGEVLGFDTINVFDSFYELGGDSIQALKLMKELSEVMNYQIGISEILNYTSIAELAVYLEKNQELNTEQIVEKITDDNMFHETSSAQKRLFALNKIEKGSISYNLPQGYIISGNLNIEKLEKAFNEIIQRHEILRTTFEVVEGEVVQKIHENYKMNIVTKKTNNVALNEIIQECITEFDLSKLPLLRGFIITTEDKKILIVDMHHIIVDGTSKAILMKELVELYLGKDLLELTHQYKDFVYWQNRLLQEGKLKKQADYWKNKLAGEIPVLNLPTDYKRPVRKNFNGNKLEFDLGKDISAKLKKYVSEKACTLYMAMIAAYYTLLYKYTGQEDIIVGSPMAGRGNPSFDKTIGMFISTIVLRNTVSGNMKFEELLNTVKVNTIEAIDNQEYPIDYLIGELDLKRDLSRNPLFDTMFSMLNMPKFNINMTDVEISEFNITSNVSKFDLTMEVEEKDDDIIVRMEYSTELFREDTIRRMIEHYFNILNEIVSKSNINIDEIDMVTDIERNTILYTLNNTNYEYVKEKSLGDIFEERVKKVPNHVAIQFKDKQITYNSLNEKVNRIARLLMDKDIKQGSKVAIIVERDEDLIAYMLASLKIGAAYIPIDPTYPVDRIEYILKDSKTNAVISNKIILNKIKEKSFKTIDINRENIEVYDSTNINIRVNAETDAYIIYTSGSTGNPKGVRISHRAIHNFIHGVVNRIDFNDSKSILALTTISFDIFVLESLLPLSVGMKIVLADESEQMDPNLLAKVINDNSIDIIQMTPSRAQMLIKYCNDKKLLSSISDIMLGGEAIPLQLVESIKDISKAKIYNMYGPTETTVWSSISELTNKNYIDAGTPITNTHIYIVNAANKLQSIGLPGELCIAGDGLSNGYLNRDELTEERFIDNPFEPGSKMYKTGDLASWNTDGTINILGRMDTQVKVRGYRVELGEIESQLVKFKEIKEAVVTVKSREDNDSYIVAYYISDVEISNDKIRDFLSESLTDYMIPSYFCKIDRIPTTPNGKIDRKRLPDIDCGTMSQQFEENITSYKNNIEKEIFKIWVDILGRKNFSTKNNFFDVGGTSITLIKLHSEIDKKYPDIFSVTDLFEYTTIEKISQHIKHRLYGEEVLDNDNYHVENKDYDDIAVVGVSANLPSGLNVNDFWNELRNGTDLIGELPENRKKDSLQYINYANRAWNNIVEYRGFLKGAFLDEIDKFDYGFFNISPREASLMDPNQRLLLQTIWGAIEDSGYGDGSLCGSKTGIYVGHSEDFGISYKRMIEADKNSYDGIAVPGNIKSILAGRIAFLMDFKGPSIVVDTACSSSLVAVDLACKDIRNGKCDQAIVGGSNIILLPLLTQQKIGIEASDSHAKTFDERSDGTGLGEGVIAVLLKPLKKALADNDNIYALIKGSAVNQDGNSIGLTAPNAKAQEEVLITACEDAGVRGDTIGYIEAHGTGTKLGDPIEIQGITKALRKYTDRRQFCAVGSLKTNIGHLDNCAGLAGFLKAVLILKNREIPPTLYFDTPNRKIKFEESPVYVNDILRPWEESNIPRRCAVNAFGLSGTNCCIILEEAPLAKINNNYNSMEIFKLSAQTEGALINLVKEFIIFLETDKQAYLADVCYTANTGRKDYKYRIAFVIRTREELLTKLKEVLVEKELKR